MTFDPREIATLVTSIQDAFLVGSGPTPTAADVRQRFGIDRPMCQALLDALVNAHVLMKTDTGAYTRFFPLLLWSQAGAR